jgi:D-sedoheptulose 7-phosphate isomerase
VANDTSYDEIFVAQLETLYRPGDVLLVISASGNSESVVRAARWVKSRDGVVLGLLGFDGGHLGEIVNRAVVVTTAPGEYGPVEDAHMVLGHLVTEWLKESRT